MNIKDSTIKIKNWIVEQQIHSLTYYNRFNQEISVLQPIFQKALSFNLSPDYNPHSFYFKFFFAAPFVDTKERWAASDSSSVSTVLIGV